MEARRGDPLLLHVDLVAAVVASGRRRFIDARAILALARRRMRRRRRLLQLSQLQTAGAPRRSASASSAQCAASSSTATSSVRAMVRAHEAETARRDRDASKLNCWRRTSEARGELSQRNKRKKARQTKHNRQQQTPSKQQDNQIRRRRASPTEPGEASENRKFPPLVSSQLLSIQQYKTNKQ